MAPARRGSSELRRSGSRSAAVPPAAAEAPAGARPGGAAPAPAAGGAAAGGEAHIHWLTLEIAPGELEASFWRDDGARAYANADRYCYAATIFNTAALTLHASRHTRPGAVHLLDACPPHVLAVVRLLLVYPLHVAAAALAFALLFPSAYRRAREPIVMAQRLMRAVNTPAFPACTSAAAYGSRVAGELAGAGDMEPLSPSWVAVKHILLLGILWVLQILLFSVRFRWAAAIQLAAAAAGAGAARSLACALKSHAPVARAAGRLCGWVDAAAIESLGLAGSQRRHESSGACGAAPVEFWVALVFAFTSLLPLYILYRRERRHKLRYIRSKGRELAARSLDLGVLASPGRQHAMAVVGCAILSILIAEGAVALGYNFHCSS